ncbi:hypothetical protein EVA_11440 [gut metagenome]|uniref:Uncharacterized protein n=1 Tax=gut metagenome TaxID=749906 RepID=J9G0U7_9ZZZZ
MPDSYYQQSQCRRCLCQQQIQQLCGAAPGCCAGYLQPPPQSAAFGCPP